MINLENLVKKYRTTDVETTALDHINLSIQKGDFIGVMGPSGCGKSTLLNVVGMLDGWNSGSYRFMDTEVKGQNEVQRTRLRKKHIGFIFQNFNLIDELTVYQNVELPLLYQEGSKSEKKQKIESVLSKLKIDHRARHFPQQLSGGQQQRVAIARALVYEPEILLADEPTGNLDSANSQEVLDIITGLHKEGHTIMMVTHSEHDASFCQSVIHMKDGAIVNQIQNSHA
ncbi:MAG TPA: phosphonate ABC transporter ATP-binding protein [Cryomorphaceae bacterium]|nr:phosphonate ABC transporter ATP-binding protein [Owenweeksia sp.]HBF20953.1 phosphonate ABC transporter ATP-binding protein [Cryomorphaceae bacterium]|tara:strand:+ start:103 stop:786 length:684 start_codon:yes stop_codon:yes gene_type:complete